MKSLFTLLVASLAFVTTYVLATPIEHVRSPEEGNLFEGDIAIDGDWEDVYNAISRATQMWPNGIVPYTVQGASSSELQLLQAAISDYRTYTCIRWVPRTTESAYVKIIKGGGCYSNVGTLRRVQTLSLGRGCWNKGIIIHEMMHAVGFWHEQSRSDRDNYVTIMLQNVRPGMEHNFQKMSSSQAKNILSYDYGSIMHYGPTAFTKNGQRTIVPRQSGVTIGQRRGFSNLDIQKINILYNCKGGATIPPVTARPTTRRTQPTVRTIRPTFPTRTTPRQTPRPTTGTCRDRSSACDIYKRQGFCNQQFYRDICSATCCVCGDCSSGTTRPTQPKTRPTTPRPTTCRDRSSACDIYKRQGFCNQQFYRDICSATCCVCGDCSSGTARPTQPKTRPTTPRPTTCKDQFDNCPFFKSQGYCAESYPNKDYFRRICPLSCEVCSSTQRPTVPTTRPTAVPKACKDIFVHSCPDFKRRGLCASSNSKYYKSICPLSCGVCGSGNTRVTVVPTTPTVTRSTDKPIVNGNCGKSKLGHDKYIVGGKEAQVGRWPWMADLYVNGRHSCGGSVIAAKWILTAAHCVKGKSASSLKIRVGWHNQRQQTQNGVEHAVMRVVDHKQFGSIQGQSILNDNDIALLQLTKDIDFKNEHVNTVCLPKKGEQFSGSCVATGWGMTIGTGDNTKLREVTVPVYTTANCNKYWPGRVSDRQICMGTVPPSQTKTACMGDSGGPLVCKKNGRWIQAGVTSWGMRVCTGKPAVYTRTSEYLDWIDANMK
ncbi:unnamed protein product [Owenia fusiformis]|uniref:Uncharacterized protein n=1 Tax=Owenia fusiformis TaxID=6347 RepID=A0A8J1TTV7_OWEFU|nr:unnamed protein product [Owenia fusiformis]